MFSTYLAFAGDRDTIAAVATGRAPTTRSAPEHTIPIRPFTALRRFLGWARRRSVPAPVTPPPRWVPYVANPELEPARAC
jgi:hypothetical protein